MQSSVGMTLQLKRMASRWYDTNAKVISASVQIFRRWECSHGPGVAPRAPIGEAYDRGAVSRLTTVNSCRSKPWPSSLRNIDEANTRIASSESTIGKIFGILFAPPSLDLALRDSR